MKSLVIYIHGKGGNANEANHYKLLFPNGDVIGFDYKSETPWDAKKEFSSYFDSVFAGYDEVCLIANSIGAFFFDFVCVFKLASVFVNLRSLILLYCLYEITL